MVLHRIRRIGYPLEPVRPKKCADMLWSFHRGGEHLVYEIRTRTDAAGFELIIRKQDGTETIEYFDDHSTVDQRAEELQRDLIETGWWLAGDPRR